MKTKRILLCLGAAFMLLAPAPITAQELADSIQEIRLVDGSTLYGVVLDDADPLRIRLLSGDEMLIARARVREMKPALGHLENGEFWRDDPNLTRLFFAPTARTMPQGKGYIANYELFFPFVAVGVTDNLLVAGGTHLFGDLTDDRVVYLAPKLRLFSNGATDFAIGGFFLKEIGNTFSDIDFGALYGVLTSGTPDRAISLAVGAGYDEHGFVERAVVMFGAEMRVSRTLKLVTENYLLPEVSLLSFGPRFFGERLSADLGIGFAVDDGEVYTLPIVNFVYVW